MTGHTIKSLKDGYVKKEFSPGEILDFYFSKIKKEDSKLNAFLSIFGNWKLEIGNSQAVVPLWGIPYALKDNIMYENAITTAGSKILENYRASFSATAVNKLREDGAICLGKTNCDEFAMGTSTENSAFGPTRNPLDTERVPGGSSGGSAAAVAADLAVFALGSDTGGSVRQPASMCGVVGLKPTYGRVSRHGLIAMASSFDQIGPLTKTVEDAATILNVIAGPDKYDSTAITSQPPDFTKDLKKSIKGLVVGVPKEFFSAGLASEVKERIDTAVAALEKIGAKIIEISLPHFEYALATYYVAVPCEISANLSRYDGIRYGYSVKGAATLLDTYLESRSAGFGPEVKRRIMLGTYALSAGYYDAYYLKAQKVRALIKKDFDEAFRDVDAIVGPTTPHTTFKIGEKISDPLTLYLEDIYTVPVNLAGLPGISVPCGLGRESGMPVGFQIITNQFEETKLLNVAWQLEQTLK